MHLSLGIFDRRWTLLEQCCKELDFSLATDGSSATSFPGASADLLTNLSNLKLEFSTSAQYKKVISDLLTYITISTEDVSADLYHKSLVDELEAVKRRTKDLVKFTHIDIDK